MYVLYSSVPGTNYQVPGYVVSRAIVFVYMTWCCSFPLYFNPREEDLCRSKVSVDGALPPQDTYYQGAPRPQLPGTINRSPTDVMDVAHKPQENNAVLVLLRRTILNGTYGTHKNLHFSLFLLTVFGPIYYGPPLNRRTTEEETTQSWSYNPRYLECLLRAKGTRTAVCRTSSRTERCSRNCGT